jgi:hypothetical protein
MDWIDDPFLKPLGQKSIAYPAGWAFFFGVTEV